MVQITPKMIAFDLGVKDFVVRAMLRERYGKPDGKRWRWSESEARAIKKWLAKALGRQVQP